MRIADVQMRRHPAGREQIPDTSMVRAPDPTGVLSLQRAVGNRATHNLLARAVVIDTKVPMVRFSVGSEVTPALAAAAWARTEDGALDVEGIAALRQLALDTDATVDDDERMFIAALLDPLSARRLHALFPRGFGAPNEEIEFPVSWITPAARATVRDFGRSSLPRPFGTPSSNGTRRRRAQALDDQIVRMSRCSARRHVRHSPSRPAGRSITARSVPRCWPPRATRRSATGRSRVPCT
jgi:hypothetical protein